MEFEKNIKELLDRIALKIATSEEAATHNRYWKSKSPTERLQAGFYMIPLQPVKHPLIKQFFQKENKGLINSVPIGYGPV